MFLKLAVFSGIVATCLALCRLLGVMPMRGRPGLLRRADNPELFDMTLFIVAVIVGGILVIASLGEWARLNSEAATTRYLQAQRAAAEQSARTIGK